MTYGPLPLVVALALTACGGRTPILDTGVDPPAGGTGGAGSADGGACGRLIVTGAPLALPYDDTPKLVPWTEDGSQVGVIHPDGPPAVAGILATSFTPWDEWPSSLPPGIMACASCMVASDMFSVSPALPAVQPGFSLLAVNVTHSGGKQPSYEVTLRPAVPAVDAPVTVPDPIDGVGPSSLARGAAGHLLAYAHGLSADQSALRMAYVAAGSDVMEPLADVGCGHGAASVIPVQGGFLASVQSGFGSGGGACDDPVLTVVRVDESTKQIAVTATIPDTQFLNYVGLARRNEGVWLVYQPTSLHAESPGPLRAVRLTESGALDGPVVEISQGGDYVSAMAVMGSRLVLAGIQAVDSLHALQLIVLDEDGQVQRVSLDVSPTVVSMSESLLSSPDGNQLLLGYSGSVVRLACTSGD